MINTFATHNESHVIPKLTTMREIAMAVNTFEDQGTVQGGPFYPSVKQRTSKTGDDVLMVGAQILDVSDFADSITHSRSEKTPALIAKGGKFLKLTTPDEVALTSLVKDKQYFMFFWITKTADSLVKDTTYGYQFLDVTDDSTTPDTEKQYMPIGIISIIEDRNSAGTYKAVGDIIWGYTGWYFEAGSGGGEEAYLCKVTGGSPGAYIVDVYRASDISTKIGTSIMVVPDIYYAGTIPTETWLSGIKGRGLAALVQT